MVMTQHGALVAVAEDIDRRRGSLFYRRLAALMASPPRADDVSAPVVKGLNNSGYTVFAASPHAPVTTWHVSRPSWLDNVRPVSLAEAWAVACGLPGFSGVSVPQRRKGATW